MYIWIIYPKWYASFSNIIFNNNTIKISDIYVTQYYISDNPDLKNISMENYKQ